MINSTNPHILHIDSSVQGDASVTRGLTQRAVDRLAAGTNASIIHRDVSQGIPIIDGTTVGATFTPPEDRTDEQRSTLELGQSLIDELIAADQLVIGMPMYNFGPPASLKAWADQIVRAGVTFRYTETGQEALLADKATYVVVASGGVPIGSQMDWASGWIKQLLGFIGITSVQIVGAEGTAMDLDGAVAAASEAIDNLIPAQQDG